MKYFVATTVPHMTSVREKNKSLKNEKFFSFSFSSFIFFFLFLFEIERSFFFLHGVVAIQIFS
jgi:hypothetical protein